MSVRLKATPCFHGGAIYDWIGNDFSNKHAVGHVIDADVLDAWFDPSPRSIEALRQSLAWSLRSSPPAYPGGVVRMISQKIDVDGENILCGAGSSALMFLALRELLSRDSRVLILDPSYGEYAHICRNVIGCRVESFKLNREDNFAIDVSALIQSVQAAAYDMVIIVNPNNPTGQLLERNQLVDAIDSFPSSTKVWIDEAYIDYAGNENSLSKFAAARANVFVCKSLSKVLALSGLRVAYLVGNACVLERFRELTPPWALSLPAQLVLIEALQDVEYYSKCYENNARYRQCMRTQLEEIGLSVIESVANFLYVEYADCLPDATEILSHCRSRGLLFRNIQNMGSALSSRCFRISVKDAETNERMMAIIREVFEEPTD